MSRQSLIVALLSPTEQDIEAVHIFAKEWMLEQQEWLSVCGSVSATYTRESRGFEAVSTWDIAYHLLEMFLEMSADRDGQRIRVHLRFSDLAYDEVELTGSDILAEAPCLCDRIRAGEEVDVPVPREDGLELLPSINALVSEANPEPWMTWLPKRCELRGQCNGVLLYGHVNCNYIVYQGRVIRNFGYHGRVAFQTLACPKCAHRMLMQWKHHAAILRRSLYGSYTPGLAAAS